MNSLLKSVLVVFALLAGILVFVYVPMVIAELPRMRFQNNLKKRATAAELQVWAANTLSPFQANADSSDMVTVTNLHPAFRGLDKWPPHAAVYADSQSRFDTAEAVAYIKITYGSAAGHFGLVIGPTNLPTPASRAHEIRYTTWAPGTWFFDGQ